MTVNKALESFKQTDFDVDYFVQEAQKSSSNNTLLSAQLDEFVAELDSEMNLVVKQALDIILNASHVSDTVIGELLSAREHIAVLKSGLESISRDESKRVETMKSKHTLLKRALSISQLLKKASRFSLDAAKLRAQIGNTKQPALRSIVDQSALDALACLEDLESLALINSLKEDVAWIRSLLKQPTDLVNARSKGSTASSVLINRQITN